MAEFKKQFFGYDVSQVDEVISRLDDMIEGQQEQLNDLSKQLETQQTEKKILVAKLAEYEEKETAIKEALLSAKDVATSMVSEAETTSGTLVDDAKNQSQEILKQAEEKQNKTLRIAEEKKQEIIHSGDTKVREIRAEYSTWVSRHNKAIDKFRAMLEAQLNLLSDEQYKIDNFGLPDISKLVEETVNKEIEEK